MPSGLFFTSTCLPYLFIPAPVIGTSSGLPGALLAMFSVAASDPTASGVKWTAIVQLLPGRRWGVQTWPMLNWDASPWVTVNEMGPMFSIVKPVLVRVTTCFLGRLTTTFPKLTLLGEAINVADWFTTWCKAEDELPLKFVSPL